MALTLDEVLKLADAKSPWLTDWSDPAEVQKCWDTIRAGEAKDKTAYERMCRIVWEAWPAHWRSGILGTGQNELDPIIKSVHHFTFRELLDRLFDDVMRRSIGRWKFTQMKWLALVPQDNRGGQDRGVRLHDDTEWLHGVYIPSQWWRPILSMLARDIGHPGPIDQQRIEGEFCIHMRISDCITPFDKLKMTKFRADLVIDKTPASQEPHCVFQNWVCDGEVA
ncbi:MAG: hypothetical protein WC728_11470 [Elusimicrobiota bacterium]